MRLAWRAPSWDGCNLSTNLAVHVTRQGHPNATFHATSRIFSDRFNSLYESMIRHGIYEKLIAGNLLALMASPSTAQPQLAESEMPYL
jgi:hypothetical protein